MQSYQENIINKELKKRIEFSKNFLRSNKLGNILNKGRDLKVIYQLYLFIIFSYIKFKYGNYNPLVFILYMNIYNKIDFKITKLFYLIKCFLNNEDKNILKHFFLLIINLMMNI